MKRLPLAWLAAFFSALPLAAQIVPITVDAPVGAPGAAGAVQGRASLPAGLTRTLPSLSAPRRAALAPVPKVAAAAKAVLPALSAPAVPTSPAAQDFEAAPSAPETAAQSPAKTQSKPEKGPAASPMSVLRSIASGEIGFGGGPASNGYGILRPDAGEGRRLALPKGVRLDRIPASPEEAGAVAIADRFHLSADHMLSDGSKPVVLDADPASPASIEKALRALVDSAPSQFGASNAFGRASDDMAKVHVELLPGKGEQADSFVAVFRQWKKGKYKDGSPYYLLVDGANLRFHIKVLGGKPVIMAVEGGFAADIDPEVLTQKFSDAELLEKASQRLKSPSGLPNGPPSRTRTRRKAQGKSGEGRVVKPPKWLTRSLTYLEDAWHAVDIFQASDLRGKPVIVVVDVRSGRAWAFNPESFRNQTFIPRLFPERVVKAAAKAKSVSLSPKTIELESFDEASGERTYSGNASARGTTLAPDGSDHGPTGPMPLANAQVTDEEGRVLAVTGQDGSFTITSQEQGPLTVVISLDGIYGAVTDGDEEDAPLSAKLTVLPGQKVKAVLNPTGDDEQEDAAVNAYVYSNQLFDWFKNYLGLKDPRLFTKLAGGIHPNETTMPGNAYYSPDTDGFYLMRRATLKGRVRGEDGLPHPVSVTFENTAQPSIILHELGHRFIQMASRVALTSAQLADPAYRFVKNPLEPVVEGGMNEGFADIVSMYLRHNPVLGKGFIIDGPEGMPKIIRTGENTTQYDPADQDQARDPHARGEILMGTGWKSLQGFIQKLGPAEGALQAALLFVRTTLYVQPGDIMSALTHALLADMTKDGKLPNADVLRAGAKEHGVTLPAPPGPPST